MQMKHKIEVSRARKGQDPPTPEKEKQLKKAADSTDEI